jgi:hypothetical protein
MCRAGAYTYRLTQLGARALDADYSTRCPSFPPLALDQHAAARLHVHGNARQAQR